MAKSFNKTYSMTLKFSRDDGEDLADSDLRATQLRKIIREGIVGEISSHIVGEISET